MLVSCVCCVGSGLCDEPITRLGESCLVSLCVIHIPKKRGALGQTWPIVPQKKMYICICNLENFYYIEAETCSCIISYKCLINSSV